MIVIVVYCTVVEYFKKVAIDEKEADSLFITVTNVLLSSRYSCRTM